MTQKLIKRRSATKSRLTSTSRGLFSKVQAVREAIPNVATLPKFKSGDTIRVHVRIKEGEKERIQAFEGVVIKRARGSEPSFVVRKISHGTGVERIFNATSPKIAKVEVVQSGKVRRSKLYYLRELEGRSARIERDLQVETGSSD